MNRDIIQDMLKVINEFFGYEKYVLEDNGNYSYIHIKDDSGRFSVFAERIGTHDEMNYFVIGMFQIVSYQNAVYIIGEK